MIAYKITNILNEKIYIGQTVQKASDRWNRHCRGIDKTPISLAIQKYGRENFKFEIIEQVNSLEELNQKEERWIKQINCIAPNGYNLKAGGNNYRQHISTKQKHSNIAKTLGFGKWKRKEKDITANKNRAIEQFRDETFKKEWALKKGFRYFNVYKTIKDDKIIFKGDLVGTWLTTTECAKHLDVKPKSVRQCLINKQKAHKGYIFEYIGDKNE